MRNSKMIKISAAIITLNEEINIKRCLDSLQGIVDEIIVVDSYSSDKTEEICAKYDVKFIKQKFLGHIEQKNFALDQTSHEIVLSLDADEAIDEKLKSEILKVKSNFSADAYYFNRLTNYNGHWVRHCGWYPDKKLRLFKKSKCRWSGMNPHDIIELDTGATQKYLKGDLLHYSYNSISDHVNQTNKFTTIAAKAAFSKGKRSNIFKIITRPILKFLKDYFLKRGFMDGRYGFIICCINGLSALLKYSKIKELQDGKSIDL
jgi:glycosyltransferase involved in cell wall biosynthesis